MTCRLRTWHVALVYLTALGVRWVFAPSHNLAEDPFEFIESAKHLLLTGQYRIPSIGSPDLIVRYILPSWPAGYPLLLAGAFAVFGTQETVARIVTMLVSSGVAPLAAMMSFMATHSTLAAMGAGLLAALHPLGVAFGGQVFSNNLSLTLFAAAVCLLVSSLRVAHGGGWASYQEVAGDSRRCRHFGLAFLLLGFMMAVRDTDVMYMPAIAVLLFLGKFFAPFAGRGSAARAAWWKLAGLAGGAALVGWAPGLYFNTVNFGSPFVLTHYQTGIRLSWDFLLRGSDALFGLPGFIVMSVTLLVYHFPFFFSMAFRGLDCVRIHPFLIMGTLIMVAVIAINGAFPVAATGAAPRYVLALIPFTAIVFGHTLDVVWRRKQRHLAIGFLAVVGGWLAFLTYPPPVLFGMWPRFAYLAYYSPVYVGHPYRQYPDHTNAMVRWVQAHTPRDAVIITPSRSQHFFYYGQRDVAILDAMDGTDWERLVSTRKVYLVEDRHLAVQPGERDLMKRKLEEKGIALAPVGSVIVFTPERGDTELHAYLARLTPADERAN